MARDRLTLQEELRTLASKAWFRRPPDNKMSYPCFLYRPSKAHTLRADNALYGYMHGYNVIYISKEPNENIEQQMLEKFEYCSFDREYESDGLYHYSFTLYY